MNIEMAPKPINRRKNVNSSASTVSIECLTFKPLFEDMFVGDVYGKVNPLACIDILKLRVRSECGVLRLKALFHRKYRHCDSVSSMGLTAGTDRAIVIQLVGVLSHLVEEYLIEKGISSSDVQSEMSKFDQWYGIVDGVYSNLAIRDLMENNQ